MRFDYTNGLPKRYIVSVYNWNVEDHYYFHYLKDAKALFDKIVHGNPETGTIISLNDLVQDKRKEFVTIK